MIVASGRFKPDRGEEIHMLKLLATIPFIVLASGEVQQQPAMQPVPAVSHATTAPSVIPATSSLDNDMTIQGYTGSSPCRPVFAEKAEPVGPLSGDVEKDSIGFVIVGTDCR
jgi:hypothetical protein